MKIYYPYLCSIDWLQVYCYSCGPIESGGSITIKSKDYGTKIFSRAAEVYYSDDEKPLLLGNITWAPRSSAINFRSVCLKLHNSILYSSRWYELLMLAINELHLEYRGITRLDLAYDCNKLKNGLLPLSLINNYLAKKILKIGNNSPVVSYKSLGYIIGLSLDKATKQQAVSLKESVINAVTFGQKTSGIQVQIYDKSLELKTHFKSWIVEEWERVGLDKSKVWRFEMRIQGKGKDLLQMETGEIFQLGLNDIVNQDKIDRLFLSYAYNYFRFVKRDYHVKKQQMKAIDLFCFKNGETQIKHKIIETQSVGSRSIQMAINALVRVEKLVNNNVLSHFDEFGKKAFIDLIDTLIRLYSYHDLRVKNKSSMIAKKIGRLLKDQGLRDPEIIEKLDLFNRNDI